MKRGGGLALLIAALAVAAAGGIGALVAEAVETAARGTADAALLGAEAAWGRAEVDGSRVTLSGEAADQATRRDVLAAVKAALDAAAVPATLVDMTTAPEEAAPPVREARIVILRAGDGATVTGASPTGAARGELSAAGLDAKDITRPAAPAEGWDAAVAAAARVAAALDPGRVEVAPGEIAARGVSRGDADPEAALGELPEGWTATILATAAPEPAPAATLRARTGDDAQFECVAPADEAGRLVERAAASAFALSATCAQGESVDDPAGWLDAAMAGMEALTMLPAGELHMADGRLRLTAFAPTSADDLSAAAAQAQELMPEGFTLYALAAPEALETIATETPAAPIRLRFTMRDGALRLAGVAPDRVFADSISAYAVAARGGWSVEADLVETPDVDAVAWRAAAAALIDALAPLESGEAALDGARATLVGAIAEAAEIRAVDGALRAALGDGFAVETHLTVSPARIAAAQPLPLSRCVAELNELVTARPIVFAPGSVEIEPESGPVIADLAGIVARCAGAAVEVGGHTDSQGRESTNLRLSRERAQAVMAAILAQAGDGGALLRLSAVGYGEAEPVADNGTEAGRAANRRIAFKVKPAGAAEAQTDDKGGADAETKEPER